MTKDPTEMISKYLQKKKAVRELAAEPKAVPAVADSAESSQKRKKERRKKDSFGGSGDADANPKLTRKKSQKSLLASEDAPVATQPSSASKPAPVAQDDSEKPKSKKKPRHSVSRASKSDDAVPEESSNPVPTAGAAPSKPTKKSKKAAADEPTDNDAPDDVHPKKSRKTASEESVKKSTGKQGKKDKAAAGGISKQWLVQGPEADEEDVADDDAEAHPVLSKRKPKVAAVEKPTGESKKESATRTKDTAEKITTSKTKNPKATVASKEHKDASLPSKKSSKHKSPTPPIDDASEREEKTNENDEPEKTGDEVGEEVFMGFETDDDDDDSSDDEDMDFDPDGMDVSKLPTIAKDDATVKRKLERAKKQPTEDRGVIYLGRIPHGFYEAQMKAYFSQFGTVTRLRLSRNKQTGRSKHYGFIEFDSASVAQIVAETMDNYLLTGHILTCKVIPKDKIHPELWVGANRKWRVVPRDRVARMQHNKPRTEEEQEHAEKRLLKRQAQKKRKLEEAGIKYDFDAVAYKKRPKSSEA